MPSHTTRLNRIAPRRWVRRRFVLCLLVFLTSIPTSHPLWAWPGSGSFQSLGPENGLPHRTVYDVAVDPQGFLWLATQNGLARYDGYDLRVFRNDPKDSDSLPNNYVKTLAFDAEGFLWVGTNGGGLSQFDPSQETFTTHRLIEDGQHRATQVDRVIAAGTDHLWLAGGQQVHLFRPSQGSFQKLELPPEDAESVGAANIFADPFGQEGEAWYVTPHQLLRLEPDPPQLTLVKKFPTGFQAYAAFTEDSERLWLASEQELIDWHPKTDQWTSRVQLPESSADVFSIAIRPMVRDMEGHFWLGLLGAGLFRLDPHTEEPTGWSRYAPSASELQQVLAIAEDPSGILWFATYADGLAKLDPTRQGATFLRHSESVPQSLSPFGVRAVAAGSSGRTWVGHFGSGIDVLDPQGNVTFRLSTSAPERRRISHDAVWALHEDDAGQLWIGHETGLDRYDTERDVVRRISFQDGPLTDRIIALMEDASGQLYIGGNQGLYLRRPGQAVVSQVLPLAPLSQNPSQDMALRSPVHALRVDSDGFLWIGTDGDGLFRLDPNHSRLQHFQSRLAGPSQIQLDIVSEIHQDDLGKVWITTLGGGLLRFDPDQQDFVPAFTDRPLLSDFVSSLLPAPDGTFWLPTHNGLNRFDPATGHVDTWDASDGLPARGFTNKASTLNAQGTLFLGSRDGLYILQPDAFGVHSTAPRPVLTQFNLFNKPLALQRLDAASPLEETLAFTESLTLRYDQNPFSIQFSALHFANPSKNRYEYRLRGVDPQWVQASSDQRLAAYSHVPPGRYRFEVRATSRDGVSSERPAEMEIRILPPPWRTWWAHSLYALSLVTAVVAFVRAQRRKVSREREINRQLDELVQLRTEQLNVLRGLLPICSHCKKIRDDEGDWSEVESYVEARSEAVFSHSLCPPCAQALYPDLDLPGQS